MFAKEASKFAALSLRFQGQRGTAPYIVEAGGSVSLSTMKAVHLWPGTIVHPGGYLSAITTTCLPCASQKIVTNEIPYQNNLYDDEFQLSDNIKPNMRIFPNPSEGIIFVMLEGIPRGEMVRMEGSDMQGRIIFSEQIIKEDVNRISGFCCHRGIYLLRCISTTSGVLTGKVVIQ